MVGAGIAGLAAARDLAAAGVRPLVVDANPSPGGVMQTVEKHGYRVEAGPNSFLARGPFCAFADRHAGGRLAAPQRSLVRWDALPPRRLAVRALVAAACSARLCERDRNAVATRVHSRCRESRDDDLSVSVGHQAGQAVPLRVDEPDGVGVIYHTVCTLSD